ncbi:hypothetical protein D3C86_1814560 [compost metagenome]
MMRVAVAANTTVSRMNRSSSQRRLAMSRSAQRSTIWAFLLLSMRESACVRGSEMRLARQAR